MDPDKKKVVLVTSGQPSLNPRVVKEADALVHAGYDVTLIYQYWNEWATELDRSVLGERKDLKVIRVGGDPVDSKSLFLFTRIVYKVAGWLSKIKILMPVVAPFAIGRGSWALTNEAARHEAELYIGHNLAALPAVVGAARKFRSACGFDAEDLHRYETSNNPDDFVVKFKAYIEDRYFPQTDYLTVSSGEIAETYQKLFPTKELTIIRNVVRKMSLGFPVQQNATLKLFWFSQWVGLSRGVQDIIRAIRQIESTEVEFHILGALSEPVGDELNALITSLNFTGIPPVVFHSPVAPADLESFASQFDIGLASEPSFSENNDRALSNKIFTYMAAGLAILASDTTAQTNFLKHYPDAGKLYQRNAVASLSSAIDYYFTNRTELLVAKRASFTYAQTELNWDAESELFLHLVQKTIGTKSQL